MAVGGSCHRWVLCVCAFQNFTWERKMQQVWGNSSGKLCNCDKMVSFSWRKGATKQNSLSDFLKRYDVSFRYDHHLHMYVHGKEIDLSEKEDSFICHYLRNRFGYDYTDFDVKGFVFGDRLKEMEEEYRQGPDFFNYLYPFVKEDDAMMEEFHSASAFYQLEYRVSLADVYFEEYDELDDREKEEHFLIKVLQRLYAYRFHLLDEEDDPVLCIKDGRILSQNYLTGKIENG